MMLWVIFAAMTAAAILAVLWPLARKSRAVRAGNDVVVYRDQLAEIDRDRGAGLIGEAEAEAARVEVSRRLLAAANAQTPPQQQPLWHRRAAAVTALIVLSVVPIGLYASLGSPDIPGQPAFDRAALPRDHESIMSLVAKVEQHLARNPNDGAGWEVIAPVYLRMGRYDAAVNAWRKALALNGETAARDANLGEALVGAADGVVTDEAKKSFERAATRDPHEPKALYFLGLADEQDGNRAAAAATWRALLQNAPANAPWIGFVHEALARVTAGPAAPSVPANPPAPAGATAPAAANAPGPTAQQMAAATNMPEAERTAMIQGMVAKLADQLHADGGDVADWLRLVRAYMVLGERDKAKTAAADAKRALAAHPDQVKRIDDLVKGLGLEG
jgi:cytochrome c-type biogenesis protein CcmH